MSGPMIDELLNARSAYEAGNVDAALQLTRRHLKFRKDDVRAWELIGLIQFSRGRYRISVSALERASLLAPLRPAARVCLAHGYGRVGRYRLSRDLLAGLIPDESMSITLLLQVASGLDAIDQPHLAMQACREAAHREPGHAQAYYDQGYYAARCGLPSSLTESLARMAVSLDPQRVCFRVGLATMLINQQREDDAYELVRQFTNAQIDDVCCASCLRRIVALYQRAEDHRRAVLCQQRIISLEFQSSEPGCA